MRRMLNRNSKKSRRIFLALEIFLYIVITASIIFIVNLF